MSPRLRKPCAEHGCSALVDKGRCDEHTRTSHQRDRRWRGSARQRGYDSQWEKVRAIKLDRDPLCEQCDKNGRTRAATLVDHIVPLPAGPRLDMSNLQSMCVRCHAKKTAAETRA